MPNDLFYPESDTYNASITAFPFLQLRLHPTCVFRPKSAEDVSKAVNILRDSGCTKFAVKGGGHNANVGWANIEDGVTIDMTSLNAVDVVDNNVARVGGGAIWQNVYDVVEQRNLSVLGGRIGVVGVPGFTTGGEYMPNEYQKMLQAINIIQAAFRSILPKGAGRAIQWSTSRLFSQLERS